MDAFWTSICPTGLRPWVQTNSELAPCFQEIVLQLPVLVLFATYSSYYYGSQWRTVCRNETQLRALRWRIYASICLTVIPAVKVFYIFREHKTLYPIDILLACVQLVAWSIHCCFLGSSARKGRISHRGPLVLIVLWTSLCALSGIWLHTNLYTDYWIWYAASLLLYLCYAATLIAPGTAYYVRVRRTEQDERQALLSQSYTRFFEDFEETTLGPIEDEANLLSRFVFYWVRPLIAKGVAGKLKSIDDLFELPESLNIRRVIGKLQQALDETVSLFKSLHRCFGWEFYLIGLLRLLADLAGFAGPILLGGLLRTENPGNSTQPPSTDIDAAMDYRPYYYAIGLLFSTVISCFAGVHFNWRMTLISSKMRMAIVTAIYHKTLRAKRVLNARSEILNLMSTDTDRIVNSCVSFHSFWSIPFQLFTTLYLLYTQLGVAFTAGVFFAVLLIPINRKIAQTIGRLSQGLMEAKDARVSITSESISGAKDIKLNAWEDVFIKRIEQLRDVEIGFLSKRKYLDALCVYFWATTPVLMCLFTFGTYVLVLGQPLTAAATYTSVALLNMLIGPLNAFPWVLNGLTEAWVSLKRVQALIELPNINLEEYYQPLTKVSGDTSFSNAKRPLVISIRDSSFELEVKRSRAELNLSLTDIVDFAFTNLNLQVVQGELVCLLGPVGGGKSSLLQVLLGNVQCTKGAVSLAAGYNTEGFGYVAQSAWLQQGTIRDNIIWGENYDETRYKAVIHACALQYDLDILGGDGASVGEQGRTLSGGQKARVSLARAVYQNKEIYLLDDILSALDAHVARHIVRYCIFGLLKNKTRIMITAHPMVLSRATQTLHVESGKITQSDVNSVGSMLSEYDDYDEDIPDQQSIRGSKAAVPSVNGTPHEPNGNDNGLEEEVREFGQVDRSVFGAYWQATGRSLGFWVIMTVVLMQVSRNITDAWLAYWVGATNRAILPPVIPPNRTLLEVELVQNIDLQDVGNSTMFYLGIYSTLALGNTMLTLVRAFLFALAGIKAAKYIHDRLLNSVIHTKLQFFDVVPLGRILNRFSSDVYTVDDTLPFILNILLAQFFGLLGALLISLYAMPWLGLLIIPLAPIYLTLQNKYRYASRDIKRLSSNALSPIYAHFTETVQGLDTIRAFRGEARFHRDFLFKLSESIRAQLSAAAAQQWLGLRLQLLGAFLVGGSGLLAAITSAHMTSPELVGLAISYALSITGLLSGLLYAVAETEQEFIAVERINQYCQLETEVNADGSADPPFGWPSQGVVVFENVSMRYREHLPCSIKSIDISVKPCERLSLVGRTGSGKTSVLSALLRVAPLDKGTITVDFVNIATLPLDVLRSRIALISQDPFLFTGTIRENLDPRAVHIDSEIWEAITCCLASPLIQSLGGLDAKLEGGGNNLSAGQKQLLCLTRALLKKSKIVLIDEGTANLDLESESAVQLILKNAFRGRTVIMVAHRLNGTLDTDTVLVMQNGTIAEQGVPRELASQTTSMFHAMLQEQQGQ
ncbi:multidrug resistance-associated protein 7-like [Anopheles albimanus]|uniref:multidrug resistance-associated protein 7-like n=1 Tax=Anopheles albimanus TaxID=7167 RepID=UPI0016407F5E|nr:multidrug resistance-associated protein 7-like [Anopheles albimanus]XP_035794204.1 multidrug resistance-associated protein 7-like [Anopheles albimanus]